MSDPTSYQLLKDVHAIVNRMDKKYDKRFTLAESKIDILETKTDNMLGKIGIGVIFISTLVTATITFIFSWVKDKL